jgi:glycosyltransferase involved in cell wall biosynthesis
MDLINAAEIQTTVDRGRADFAALLWIDRRPNCWSETLLSLLDVPDIARVYVGFAEESACAELQARLKQVVLLDQRSVVDALGEVFLRGHEAIAVVTSPVILPVDPFENASAWMLDDPRVGTISFLSNSAGYLSFPNRNTETPFGVDGHNETTLTALLRARKANKLRLPVPIPVAEGGLVLVNRSAWEVIGGFDDSGTNNGAFALAEFSLRAARRGFNNFLDPYTFLNSPWDGVGHIPSILGNNSEARHALFMKHPHFPGNYDLERTAPSSLLGESLDVARAKATGLRILIDGSSLGPKEMGTQLLILQLTRALSIRPDVQWVVVGVPDPSQLPAYAHQLKSDKIKLVAEADLHFRDAPNVDVIHRPYQPIQSIPWDRWRDVAKRSVITVQDLIAYRNASYFASWEQWRDYKSNFNKQIAQVDAVVSISNDVVRSVKEERLPIDDGRLFVIENGIDARSQDQITRIPDALINRGWASRPFLLVLGATYAHKNRDLALRVWEKLRERSPELAMVFAGASVPYGSTRFEEAKFITSSLRNDLVILPEVPEGERNWLLKHTKMAVYLTSAEGFGQGPFEAARMGVPTLYVSFGPLRELIPDPDAPVTFDLNALLARAEALLSDPSAARKSINNILANLDRLTWAETARKTVDTYLEILDKPRRSALW